jgi:hypothetical protein
MQALYHLEYYFGQTNSYDHHPSARKNPTKTLPDSAILIAAALSYRTVVIPARIRARSIVIVTAAASGLPHLGVFAIGPTQLPVDLVIAEAVGECGETT